MTTAVPEPSPPAALPLDYEPRRADRPLPVRYMPQLDALRALAVFAVWFEHWQISLLPGVRYVPWGSLGVWLFFVLSGFLITGILLRAKEGVEFARASGAAASNSLWSAARSFYARRFLRILPIYYLTIFVTVFVLHMPNVRRMFWWHLTYTTDFRKAMHAPFPDQGGQHFWTLAVEEQFYLLWPALILLVPRRFLVRTIFLTLIGGVAFRIVCVAIGQRGAAGVWPFACFDLFAFGAALAAFGDDARYARIGDVFCRWCLALGTPALLVLLAVAAWHQRHSPDELNASKLTVNILFNSLAAGAVFAWVIARTARGFTGVGKKILEFAPLLYLGKISYGLYIYHNFMPGVFAKLHVPEPHSLWLRFGTRALATVAIASVSWYLVEKPINGLKRYFEYAKPAGTGAAPVPPTAPVPEGAGQLAQISPM
jgi:peptidoglycan/LPS O-acetylase OafA/YrhL